MYLLVNAFPPKPLDIATSNFVGAFAHDVEGTGQHPLRPNPKVKVKG